MGKGKEDEKNEALAVSTEKPKGKRDMSKINCWNCGESGHFSSKCNKPKKAKEASTPNPKKEGPSAAAVETSSDDEGAWVAEEKDSGCVDWLQELVDDVESDRMDWFEEVVSWVDDDEVPVMSESSCLGFKSVNKVLEVDDDLPDLLVLVTN